MSIPFFAGFDYELGKVNKELMILMHHGREPARQIPECDQVHWPVLHRCRSHSPLRNHNALLYEPEPWMKLDQKKATQPQALALATWPHVENWLVTRQTQSVIQSIITQQDGDETALKRSHCRGRFGLCFWTEALEGTL